MAMAAETSSHKHSLLSGEDDGDGHSNPTRTPWAQVVRGEQDSMLAAPSPLSSPPPPPPQQPPSVGTAEQTTSPDGSASNDTPPYKADGNNSNAGNPKKAAWNKPLNGVVDVGPVMGDVVSWPALSESTRFPLKSASDSAKTDPDASVSTSQGPVISPSPQNEKQAYAKPGPNFTANNSTARQRSSKRGGGAGGGSLQSGFNRLPPPPPSPLPPPSPSPLPPPPPFPVFEMPFGALVPAVPDFTLREPSYKANSWEGRPVGGFVSQPRPVNVQSSHRNSSRRGNFGGRSRGDGPHQDSHGSRRGQERDWNASRNSNSRDFRMPPQIAPPGDFMIPPTPGSAPFIPPQSMRPFGHPMGFDMTPQLFYVPTLPESFRGVPFIAHTPPPPPPMFFPVPSPTLPTLLVNQIDYYFSDINLSRDEYLRSKMDEEGWVPVNLIAGFPRVQQLTDNIEFIVDSLRASTVVEVQGNKLRRRNDWIKWILKAGRFPIDAGLQSPRESTSDTLANSLQKVSLDGATFNQSSITDKVDSSLGVSSFRSLSEEAVDCSEVENGECINEGACSSQI